MVETQTQTHIYIRCWQTHKGLPHWTQEILATLKMLVFLFIYFPLLLLVCFSVLLPQNTPIFLEWKFEKNRFNSSKLKLSLRFNDYTNVGWLSKYTRASFGHFNLNSSRYHPEWYRNWKPNHQFSFAWKPDWKKTETSMAPYLNQGFIYQGTSKIGIIWTLEYEGAAFQQVFFVNLKFFDKRNLFPSSFLLCVFFSTMCSLIGIVLEILA